MAEWVCNPHGTRVEQEDEPKGTCPEADRSSCFWEKVPTAATTLGKYASTAYLDAKAKREQTEANAAARRTAE